MGSVHRQPSDDVDGTAFEIGFHAARSLPVGDDQTIPSAVDQRGTLPMAAVEETTTSVNEVTAVEETTTTSGATLTLSEAEATRRSCVAILSDGSSDVLLREDLLLVQAGETGVQELEDLVNVGLEGFSGRA